MAYVEWLRVKKTLIVLSIVLGALFLIAVVIRISANSEFGPGRLKSMIGDGATVVSTQAVPGGTRTVYKTKNGDTVTVTDRGADGVTGIVTGPTVDAKRSKNQHVRVGPFSMTASKTEVDFETNGPIDVGILFAYLTIFGAIVATVLAAPLARENERLEVAWTKPIDRTLYALQLYGVDMIGIVAAMLIMLVACIAAYTLFQIPHLTLTAGGALHALVGIVACAAWYAMFAAITSWMKRGFGAFIGIAWPVALFVPGLALIGLGGSVIGETFHWFFQILAAVDPLAYLNLSSGIPRHNMGLASIDEPLKLLVLAALALVYAGAGLIEWRRVEA